MSRQDHAPHRQITGIAVPPVIWALHFILVYAALSAACAPRALLDFPALHLLVGLASLIALGAIAVLMVRVRAAPGLGRAARWGGLIFAAAIIMDVVPMLLLTTCNGG